MPFSAVPPRPRPFPPLAPPTGNLQRISPRTFRADDSVIIKRGELYQVKREVDALEFVGRHTSIPIPALIESHVQEGYGWFSMKTLPGQSLTHSWPLMSEESRATTRNELRAYLEELRAIPLPDPPYIGSCTGDLACDYRLNNGLPCGPFRSESEFNDLLVEPVRRCPRQELVGSYRRQLADDHDIVFSHADLDGQHILAEQTTGKITGIIDWETAGWWPEYWEYTKAQYGSRYDPWWKKLLSEVLKPYKDELQIEFELQDF